jgi:hypothetical protein
MDTIALGLPTKEDPRPENAKSKLVAFNGTQPFKAVFRLAL